MCKTKNDQTKYIIIVVIMISMLILPACNQNQELAKGIFYQVFGGENDMYILGSVHLGNEEMYPLKSSVEIAYKLSSTLVLEASIEETDLDEVKMALTSYIFIEDGLILTDMINDDLYQRITSIITPEILEEDILLQLKPWYIAQIISQTAQKKTKYKVELGVDQYFLDRALHRRVVTLETLEDQIEPYLLMSTETSVKYLEQTLEDYSSTEEALTELIDYWYQGDYEAVDKVKDLLSERIDTKSYDLYIESMLDKRNYEMTQKLDKLLRNDIEETHFVVVGYLHLAGDNSIISYLEELGYTCQKGT